MRLPGSYHSSWPLGEGGGEEKNLEAERLLEALHLPARLPSESTAPGRVTPKLGGALPFLQVLRPAPPLLPAHETHPLPGRPGQGWANGPGDTLYSS